MFFRLLVLLITTTSLFSSILLEKNYLIDGKKVKLSHITKNPKNNEILFNIKDKKHIKRVKSKELIELLKRYNIKAHTKHSYIQFTQKSPIKTQALQDALKHYYLQHYPKMQIHSITVEPRSFLDQLPQYEKIKFQKRSYLKKDGVFSIVTPQHKEIFFNYTINATLPVYITKKKIQRADPLSVANLKYTTITFERFNSPPLTELTQRYQAKRTIKPKTIVTLRDVEPLLVVKRGDRVSATLKNGVIDISFSAKALQNGTISDIITIQTEDGKKLRAKVIGKGVVKVQ